MPIQKILLREIQIIAGRSTCQIDVIPSHNPRIRDHVWALMDIQLAIWQFGNRRGTVVEAGLRFAPAILDDATGITVVSRGSSVLR